MHVLPLLAILCSHSAPAGGPIYPVQQQRALHTEALAIIAGSDLADSDDAAAADFAPYVQSIESLVTDGFDRLSVQAGQNSLAEPQRIFASGLVQANAEHLIIGEARSASEFRMAFAIDQPAIYTLDGLLTASAGFEQPGSCCNVLVEAGARVRLSRVAGEELAGAEVVLEFNAQGDPMTEQAPLAAAGELAAGVYELIAEAHGDSPAINVQNALFHLEAAFVATLTVTPKDETPILGDLDQDGDVDLADFAIFQRAFGMMH